MVKLIDLTGQKFHKWTVLSLWGKGEGKDFKWNCVCECGNYHVVFGSSLRCGTSKQCKSCGSTKHGQSRTNRTRTRSYHTWCDMMARCYNPNHPKRKDYGGRGIEVCDRWRGEHGFENFVLDKGECPEGLTLDRFPDKNGDYTPENTRWATSAQQARNRRDNKITFEIAQQIREINAEGNVSQTELSIQFKVSRRTISKIIKFETWN